MPLNGRFGDALKQFEFNRANESAPTLARQLRPRRYREESQDSTNSSVNSSTSKVRKKKKKSAPKDCSQLKPLKPLLQPGLRCVFIGFNPGYMTALKGHYYAHHSNLFWKLIYESGCVDRPVTCYDDHLLPDEFGYGFTDLIARPTTGISELSNSEMLGGVPVLEAKITTYNPKVVAIVGKGIYETVFRFNNNRPIRKAEFSWGLQPEPIGSTRVFVLPSTSGLVAGVSRAQKLASWTELANYLNDRHPFVKPEPLDRVKLEPLTDETSLRIKSEPLESSEESSEPPDLSEPPESPGQM
ncbi:hypothetical protein TRVA0_045S00408 [Trichomonascus vanleenenianus]|uniref:mismatch-specific DNA-glycosylase n=1 Tax=Trichomonascus vanleenenianus TaxID=2268995 RepID=UPI003ECAF371